MLPLRQRGSSDSAIVGRSKARTATYFLENIIGREPSRTTEQSPGESLVPEFATFDCVGLVNYCYARHWYKTNFGLDIAAYRNANQGTTGVDDNNDRMDADILIKSGNHHIGMLYSSDNDWFVVQAVGTTRGLTDDERFTRPSGTAIA
jgi:hypothetical protein